MKEQSVKDQQTSKQRQARNVNAMKVHQFYHSASITASTSYDLYLVLNNRSISLINWLSMVFPEVSRNFNINLLVHKVPFDWSGPIYLYLGLFLSLPPPSQAINPQCMWCAVLRWNFHGITCAINHSHSKKFRIIDECVNENQIDNSHCNGGSGDVKTLVDVLLNNAISICNVYYVCIYTLSTFASMTVVVVAAVSRATAHLLRANHCSIYISTESIKYIF